MFDSLSSAHPCAFMILIPLSTALFHGMFIERMPKRYQHRMTHVAYEQAIRERFSTTFQEPAFRVVGGPTVRWPGRYSGIGRQVDAGVIRVDTPASPYLVADAKRHAARLNVHHVEAFLGFMRDVGCSRGVLASLLGGSPAAVRRAKAEGLDLHVVDYAEALSFDWHAVVGGIFPWDSTFHPVMAQALSFLARGRTDDFIDAVEGLPFEEWTTLFTVQNLRASALRALRTIAEEYPEADWRFNALQLLEESGEVHPIWLRERLREDAEIRELVNSMLSPSS